jgi:hypothetical protein
MNTYKSDIELNNQILSKQIIFTSWLGIECCDRYISI